MKYTAVGILAVGALIGFTILLAFPMMYLVNYLFTKSLIMSVFGTPYIDIWQALWFNVFCAIAFRSTSTSFNKK